MNKKDFYKNYIPALIKALENDNLTFGFYVKGPEQFFNFTKEINNEMDRYLDMSSGKDEFLDKVAYYFDAKSHNIIEVQGIPVKEYKEKLKKEILMYKKKFNI
ncbi:hypothetical protein [Bizionia sp.]|uniref:hypothetical protein n=1 Tax=Bizionia sp. TaxID=1954480 RepID=UPI003A95C24F